MEPKKIEAIKKYLSFYDAKYYDVQAELIDHFATAIEKYQKENPKLTFKEAFTKANRSFGGRKGMLQYMNEAERTVRKKTNRMLLKLLLDFLYWPYILISIFTVFGWHLLFNAIRVDPDYFYFLAVIAGAIIVWGINAYQIKNVKMYMPRQANRSLGYLFYFAILLPGNHLVAMNDNPDHTLLVTYFSLLTFIYISLLRLPGLAIRETRKKYPQIA